MARRTSTEQTEMPFLDHLEELRWRILKSLAALVVGVGAAFAVVVKYDVVRVIERPILPYLHGNNLVYTHPADPFQISLSVAVAIGVVLALPVILYQAWAFLAPALYQHERRLVLPVLFGALALFVAGVSLSFFVVLPLAVEWLMGFQTASLTPMITASEYFNFAVSMSLAFGLCFELPIVILALAALGLVTPEILNRYRRHALVICVIIGAFLTPGDLIWTTVAMAVPLYFLYEISVALTYVIYRRRRRREAAEQRAADAERAAGEPDAGNAEQSNHAEAHA
jgi:sec-independent protein translocase protein TatC